MTSADVIDVPAESSSEWFLWSEAQGWGDGLPTIEPTEQRVGELLAGTKCAVADLVPMPPRYILPEPRVLAANAVMAGCGPEHFPVVLAAVRAVLAPSYNLRGTLATTHPCTPMILVSGPAVNSVNINAGGNCFGQGTRANAVIGRALSLILMNIGGAYPQQMDYATHGTPAKYTFCFGENSERSPWEDYHVRRGFDPTDSVVTVMSAEAPHNVNDHGSTSGEGILLTIAGTMAQAGSNNTHGPGPHFLVIGPEHAETLQQDKWSIEDIQSWLWEHARLPVDAVSEGNRKFYDGFGKQIVDGHYPIGPNPQELHIVVAGGAGKHSMYIPSFALTEVSHAKIEFS